jgi:hypothetical protein
LEKGFGRITSKYRFLKEQSNGKEAEVCFNFGGGIVYGFFARLCD